MKVSLIGIGMDGIATLTKEAETAIQESEILIGAERMLSPFQNSGKQLLTAYKPQEIADFLHKSEKSSASVLLSGDVGFYSGAEKLRVLLNEHELHVYSGIASPVYFADKIGIPWENMKFISLHGTENNIVIHVRQNPYCFFLLGGEMSAEKLCQRLCEYGMKQIKIHIGERLGYPEERILSGTAEAFQHLSVNYLSVLIAENPDFCRNTPFLIPEADFYDDSVPEHVPITKAEIRHLAVSSLEIEKHHICWDIGSGTGSVSVELALSCPDGKVYTLDKNPSACQLTNLNAHR
ncbi:MAG: precorrin-6y C5,15-methyltransferase (decarboxylating) subunit CbiE, partial [Oscillospiraceae bacterium]|nr:precorrin-6y C5,15-methyltransferase (decarboxylating) subunit CbiE [Oscillospiraceae bacterium]